MTSIKGFILLFVSVGIGTFVNKIMENIHVNVWIARASGCFVAALITFVAINFFLKSKHENHRK